LILEVAIEKGVMDGFTVLQRHHPKIPSLPVARIDNGAPHPDAAIGLDEATDRRGEDWRDPRRLNVGPFA
jgi:hypothetical protein